MNANEARELTSQNKKRNEKINKMIAKTNKAIESACLYGERRAILHDTTTHWEEPYPEVHECFKNLGFTIKKYNDGSGYYLTW